MWFFIGFSFSLNIMLIGIILFVIYTPNLSQKLYGKLENNIEVVKESKDPFKDF